MGNTKDGKGGELESQLFGTDGGDFTLVEEVPATLVGPRPERALVSLDVVFASAADAVKAYSENVGVGQIAVLTNDTLRKGTEVTVRVRVPGWTSPLQACGKVTWSRADAMGVAFTDLPGPEKDRIHKLVLEHTTLMERMKRQLGRQTEQPVPAKVSSRQTTLVQLRDEMFADVITEVLGESGFIAVSDPGAGSKPNVIVADLETAPPMVNEFKRVPLVLVNSGGPQDLIRARMPNLRARAYVPRPASPAQVLQAVRQVFGAR